MPRGTYTLKTSELAEFSTLGAAYRNLLGDWGSFRISLHPKKGTKTFKRSGFFIHGGSLNGSAGCVDIGGGILGNKTTKKFIKLIKGSLNATVTVTVK